MNMSGENDGLGGSVSSAASMTCCVFLPSSTTPAITLFSQPTERAGTHAGVWKQESPSERGVRGGIPFRLPIFRYALLWCAAHSVTHLMCAPSFAPLRVSSLIRALRARCAREKSLPAIFSRLAYRKIYCAHPHRAYTRNSTFAYQPQATRRREPPPMPDDINTRLTAGRG